MRNMLSADLDGTIEVVHRISWSRSLEMLGVPRGPLERALSSSTIRDVLGEGTPRMKKGVLQKSIRRLSWSVAVSDEIAHIIQCVERKIDTIDCDVACTQLLSSPSSTARRDSRRKRNREIILKCFRVLKH